MEQEKISTSDLSSVLETKLVIAGQLRDASNGATFERINPISGEAVSTAPAATTDDVLLAVEAAEKAFASWSKLGPHKRRNMLMRAADAIRQRRADFTEAMKAEIGATDVWANFNVRLAADMLEEAAAITTSVGGDVIPSDVPGSLAMAVRVPAGVTVGIAPWNAPVILAVRALATPLACGNTIVLKGSEQCPRTHALVIEALGDGGVPEGVVNYVTNAPTDAGAVFEAMVAHPAVRRVSFTGSTQVGRLVALTCAKYLKPVVLELGGKAPLVILDDADIEAAVQAAAFGAFMNSGQICMSTERIIVDEKIADEFVERLVTKTASLPAGDPRLGPVVLGSVVNQATVDRCNALIDDAVLQGARIAIGGKSESTLMKATLVDHVKPTMRIFRDESFGPVKPILRVRGVDEAVAVANDTEYGLSAAVFGRDIARAWQVAGRIESGICHINGPTVHDEAQMPLGGVKSSGIGRFGGRAGIAEFTDLRWITVQTEERHYPF
ncbi:salicylaldehyde dehydrogenase [Agrobacterium salinitolerans]|uniref:aldehyde dehydrogenase n=1 Tax=Agrobacterium salinitolerans TaxID=1183413 RepID=UPI00098EDDF4|nr:aldehyde dehydrogenase [Agrobacterium salinitolerans]OOO27737.1 salicylaldehyde dehydrogenase [Agrobacterium salinitolerans]PNQ25640.1 salicylaldehyde dehydrogenase [Rhizobium sp. YIC5082]